MAEGFRVDLGALQPAADGVATYRKVGEDLHDHLQGILQRTSGPDPAAQ